MKRRTKGIIMFAFFGGIMVASGVTIAIPGVVPEDPESELTITGTPADNFPDAQRAQFCGVGEAKSNTYVQEYKIPTECTQPLAIVTDHQGVVWFAQTNTGNVAKFDPSTETFTEFENQAWPNGGRSMIWGMDYAPDGHLWYTDEAYDNLWKFSTIDERYERVDYPIAGMESLPQKLEVDGSQIIVNDFTGNKLTFLDPSSTDQGLDFFSIPSPVEGSLTGDFAVDANDNIWYTNWIFQQDGVLVKFMHQDYLDSVSTGEPKQFIDFIELYQLPLEITTPNGISVGPEGNIWIADTSSSFIFGFDPITETFTPYVTSDPAPITYGNASGIIKSPVTRPYWTDLDEDGRIVFNEQTANRIGFFDPIEKSLVEYFIPSMNPNWADCGDEICGLAQVFGFTIDGNKVWFTEWAENNIGVIDTSIPLPFEVELVSDEISLKPGDNAEVTLQVIPTTQQDIHDLSVAVGNPNSLQLQIASNVDNFALSLDAPYAIKITISASEDALGGSYNVLIGAQTDEITISKYVPVTILPSI